MSHSTERSITKPEAVWHGRLVAAAGALGLINMETAMSQGKGKKRRERQEGNRRKRDPEDVLQSR